MRVLVLGATGRFGEVAGLLIGRGHAVRAATRSPNSTASLHLEAVGAELVVADYDDADSLAGAARNVDAVFATGTAHRAGPDGEARHGANLARAIAAVEAPHLVFVSGDGAAADSPLPLFLAKWQIEESIRASGVPSTILAPTYLMENLFNPWNIQALQAGVLPSPIPVDRRLQQTAVADLLALAVLAIEQPERFADRRIALASDEPTAADAAETISELIPRTLDAREAPREELPPGVRYLFDWLASTGHHVDIGALRAEVPEIRWHDYGTWAEQQLQRFRELCAHPEPIAG